MVFIFYPLFANSQAEQNKPPANYFKDSYAESRQQFLESVKSVKNSVVQEKFFASPKDKTLFTDMAWIKNKPGNTRLQVYISAVHGIEGYVGSALQSWLLTHPEVLDSSSDYVFLHALNPYGFKNNRRVNENNVDLNRSFLQNLSDFPKINGSYGEIKDFLNPSVPANTNPFSRFGFLVSSLKLIFENSIETLRKGILIGQYQYPKGIFYGGAEIPYQISILKELKDEIFYRYQKVFVVDIHTGYGKMNELHLLANSNASVSSKLLNSIFQNRVDYGDKDKFYRTTGDVISFLEAQSSSEHTIHGVVFEFGTLNSQTTLGSIESLRRIVLENQKFHFGATSTFVGQEINNLFKELFYPDNPEFRSIIFLKAQTEISFINNYFR